MDLVEKETGNHLDISSFTHLDPRRNVDTRLKHLAMNIDDYIADHIDPEPRLLAKLYRHTHLHRLYPRMCTDNTMGRLLVMLTKMIKPRRILELGTFSGYSALCFAEGMPDGCTIDTIEIDPEFAHEIRQAFDNSPCAADITLHIGDAMSLIPEIASVGKPIDMVFIDANKRNYSDYFNILLPLLPSGAFILADNTLWSDKIVDPQAKDPQTQGIRDFNDLVAEDPRVETAIIPMADGLTILRVK